MKSRVFLFFQMALLVTLPPSIGTAFSQSYDVVNLGTPLGGSFAISAGISPGGFLGGYANLTGDKTQHAILWLPGSTRDLGTFGGKNSTLLNQFSGFSETATTDPLGQDFCGTGTHLICLPLIAQYGSAIKLPLLGGNNGAAFGNNDIGQVAGVSQTADTDPSCLTDGKPVAPFFQSQASVPVVWTYGIARQLRLPSGDSEGSANAINDLGQATGSTGDCVKAPAAHAVLWKNGQPINLGSLGGTLNSNPFAINNLTQITGTSDLAGDLTSHAFLWQNGVMQDLGTLPGDYYSVGYSINDVGQIVGQSCDVNNNCRAFLWSKGKMVDLNTLIPAHSSLYLYLAAVIDGLGDIAGYAVDQSANTSPAFFAIPGFSFGSQESSSVTPHLEAVPKVSVPLAMHALMKQNLRIARGTRQVGPR